MTLQQSVKRKHDSGQFRAVWNALYWNMRDGIYMQIKKMSFIVTILYSALCFSSEEQFLKDARSLASDLRTSLMQNLSDKIGKEGVENAVPFCHANVKLIAKGAARDRIEKYEFGRTSHKVRNASNNPQPWADKYLKEFAGTKKGEIKKEYILHELQTGKNVYLEPLYVEAKCLLCHGENVAENVSKKIKELYPNDQATGFKTGEFRGFIWIKEKN